MLWFLGPATCHDSLFEYRTILCQNHEVFLWKWKLNFIRVSGYVRERECWDGENLVNRLLTGSLYHEQGGKKLAKKMFSTILWFTFWEQDDFMLKWIWFFFLRGKILVTNTSEYLVTWKRKDVKIWKKKLLWKSCKLTIDRIIISRERRKKTCWKDDFQQFCVAPWSKYVG